MERVGQRTPPEFRTSFSIVPDIEQHYPPKIEHVFHILPIIKHQVRTEFVQVSRKRPFMSAFVRPDAVELLLCLFGLVDDALVCQLLNAKGAYVSG